MRRAAALLIGVLLIGGCHRAKPDALPDAQGEAQARTSAKAVSDIAAAEEAARSSLPGSARKSARPDASTQDGSGGDVPSGASEPNDPAAGDLSGKEAAAR